MTNQVIIGPTNERLLGMPQLCALLGTNRQGVAQLIKHNADFPRPLRFIPDNPKSRLRFVSSEVLAWIAARQQMTAIAKARTAQLSHEATK